MKKEEDETGEKKLQWQSNMRDNLRQTSYGGNTPFKSKIKAMENVIFEMGSVKNAAQFSRSLLNIADYVQMKYSNEVEDAICDSKCQCSPTQTYHKRGW